MVQRSAAIEAERPLEAPVATVLESTKIARRFVLSGTIRKAPA